MNRVQAICAAALIAAGGATTTLVAQAGAHGDDLSAHGARHAAMAAIGGHMKALSAVAKGQAPADDVAAGHAKSLRGLAGTVKFLFPEEPIAEKSRAIPAIWEKWDEFAAISDQFTLASGKLVEAVASGDAGQVGAALGEVGKTCGGCHKPFRGAKK